MRPENRALAVILLAVAVVVAVGGVYFLMVPPALPASLPIPAGTVFTGNETSIWVAHFDVPSAGGRVVGAWTAFDGRGFPWMAVVNGTLSGPSRSVCPRILAGPWVQRNGTVDVEVGPGPYTVFWGSCFTASKIVITETVRVVSPTSLG